jgi:energy-converting hydrogenase A subunit M
MTEFLYEKDLRSMQYNILISTRHDQVIEEIARQYGLEKQQMRRLLIERLDMILLENIPARYQAWQRDGDAFDPIARSLGQELFTRYLPLIDTGIMGDIVEDAKERIREGVPPERALQRGREWIREVLLP